MKTKKDLINRWHDVEDSIILFKIRKETMDDWRRQIIEIEIQRLEKEKDEIYGLLYDTAN
jgi:hypothetical protein